MATRMLQRRGTSAEWADQNPVLSAGEIGFETDTQVFKLGDGVTAWNDITGPYLNRGGGTMTGALELIAPTEDNHAARKIDVDSVTSSLVETTEYFVNFGSGSSIARDATDPKTDFWWNTDYLMLERWNGISWNLVGAIGISFVDETSTFKEDGVLVDLENLFIKDDRLVLGAGETYGPWASRTQDNSANGTPSGGGLEFVPLRDIPGIRVRLSGNTSDINRLLLYDTDGVLLTTRILPSTLSSGQEANIAYPMTQGETYYIYGDRQGSTYTQGVHNDCSFGASVDINITAGSNTPGNSHSSWGINFNMISALDGALTGTGSVTWEDPVTISTWDIASQESFDNDGSVVIDIEHDTDGTGSTWVQLVSDVGFETDISDIPPEANMRFLFTLDRTLASDDSPVVEWCGRRFLR